MPASNRILVIIILSFIQAVLKIALAQPPVFNPDSAWKYLEAQCDFGPRNPGSDGHEKCLDYLTTELQKYSSNVILQNFSHYDSRLRKTYNMNNIIADFGEPPFIILCAHWDTRPWADRDSYSGNRKKPIIGANDGASGVAVLLEMARLFNQSAPPVSVKVILFDGEDYGREGEIWDYLLGSKYFAENADPTEYRYAVLLDMIGDADLEIKREFNSYVNCMELQNIVWKIAGEVDAWQFTNRMTLPITDDHLSLINIGIEAIDIIDFEYKYWHTMEDTPDKCSMESLGAVGRVLVELIYGDRY